MNTAMVQLNRLNISLECPGSIQCGTTCSSSSTLLLELFSALVFCNDNEFLKKIALAEISVHCFDGNGINFPFLK